MMTNAELTEIAREAGYHAIQEGRSKSFPSSSCSRHPAMKELDAWICNQHPEDSHTLMLYADRMNEALHRLDANN